MIDDTLIPLKEGGLEYDSFNEVIQSIHDNSLGKLRFNVPYEVPDHLEGAELKRFLKERRHMCLVNVGNVQKMFRINGKGTKLPWKRFTNVVREFLKILSVEVVSGRINFRWNGVGEFMLVKYRVRKKGKVNKYNLHWDRHARDAMIDTSYAFKMPQSSIKERGTKALAAIRAANKDPYKKTVYAPFSHDTTNYFKRKAKLQGINKKLVKNGIEPIRKYFGTEEQKIKIKERLEILRKLAAMHEEKQPEYAARLKAQKDKIARSKALFKEINDMLYTLPEVIRRDLLTFKKED